MPRKPKADGEHYYDPFPSRLRNMMMERGTIQDDLKVVLDVKSRQSITGYIDGSTIPTSDKIVALARYYGVSADYLLGLSDCPSPNEDIKTVHKVTGLSEKAIENVHALIMRDASGTESNCGPFSEMLSSILEDDDMSYMIADIVSLQDEINMLARVIKQIHANNTEANWEDRCESLYNDSRLLKYEIIESCKDLLDRVVPSESILKDARAIHNDYVIGTSRGRKEEE